MAVVAPSLPAYVILDHAETRLSFLEEGEGVIGNLIAPDKWGPARRWLERLRKQLAAQGDTPALRIEAAGLLQELGETLPDTPASRIEDPSSTAAARNQTLVLPIQVRDAEGRRLVDGQHGGGSRGIHLLMGIGKADRKQSGC